MSKEKGLIDQIRDLINPPKAEAETPAPAAPAADPVEEAKKTLEAAGYTVDKPAEAVTPEAPAPAENKTEAPKAEGKTYTEAEISAMVAEAVKAENAKKAAAQNPTDKPGKSDGKENRADKLRAAAIPAFDNLAKMVQGRTA